MIGHDLHLLGSPSVTRQRCGREFDEEESLICYDALTVV